MKKRVGKEREETGSEREREIRRINTAMDFSQWVLRPKHSDSRRVKKEQVKNEGERKTVRQRERGREREVRQWNKVMKRERGRIRCACNCC